MTILGLAESTVAPLIRALCPDDAELDRDAIAERFARAAWSAIAEPGDRDAGHLVAILGSEAALGTLTAVPWPPSSLTPRPPPATSPLAGSILPANSDNAGLMPLSMTPMESPSCGPAS